MENPIKIFQRANGLKPDGVIGPMTMNTMCKVFNKTSAQISHFLGQSEVESQAFKKMIENLNYSAQGLANTWPTRFSVDYRAKVKVPTKLALSIANNPRAIANNVYANRMGNGSVSSGDGWKHRGYGPIQTTGKANQYEFADFIKDQKIKQDPSLIATKYPMESALFFFEKNRIWRYCDDVSDDAIDKVSDAINRGNPNAPGRCKSYHERRHATLKYWSIAKTIKM